MKKLSVIGAAIIAAGLIGCGGGSGGTSTTVEKVSGTVEASYLQNVTVCDKKTGKCTKTASNGSFSLDVKYPTTLELKIGNYVLGDVNVNSSDIKITPALFAENNVTLAGYLGVFLHKAAGYSIDASVCDMSRVKNLDINASGDDLVEKVRNYVDIHGDLKFKSGDNNYSITSKDLDYYITLNPLKAGVNTVEYQGAVTVGDYATFEFNFSNDEVSYQFDGYVLNKLYHSGKFINLYKHMFFVNKDSSEFYFITSGIMLAKIVNSEGDFDIIAIPKNYMKISKEDVAKKYNIVFKNLNINGNVYNGFGILNLNDDGTFSLIMKNITSSGYDTYSGKWVLSGSKVTLSMNNNPFMNLTVKVGYKKNSIVADGIEGGYGFGSEAVDITRNDLKTYYYLKVSPESQNETKVCFGYTSEKWENNTTIQVTERDSKCMIVRSYPDYGEITFQEIKTDAPVTYTATINPSVNINGNEVKLSGIATVAEDGKFMYSFFDGDNQIYVNLGIRDGKEVGEVGSSKLIGD
ncbi:hypothetical protein [Caminibacter sp.]